MKNIAKSVFLQTGLEGNEETCDDFDELYGGLWCADKIYSDDLEFISVSFIKSFLDKECFNNKHVWDDDEYLEEYYPVQYLIKKLIE